MKKILLAALSLGVLACHHPAKLVDAAPAAPPPVDRGALLAQQNVDATLYQNASAEGARLYEQCYELAKLRLDENLRRSDKRPPAVIVDVDETVLDNSAYQVTNIVRGRGYSPATWNEWALMASAKALPGALGFLRYAEAQGCQVFYITNRDASEKNATIKNLYELGFPFADAEHVMTMENGVSDKTERRGRVAKEHQVVLLCGDQLRDFDERFKDRSTDLGLPMVSALRDSLSRYFVLLPNPMYGTWLDAAGGKVDSLKLEKKAAFLKQRAY